MDLNLTILILLMSVCSFLQLLHSIVSWLLHWRIWPSDRFVVSFFLPWPRSIRHLFVIILIHRKIYRFSNLGTSLIQSLDSLVEEGKLTGQQREAVLKQYDKVRNVFIMLYRRCTVRWNEGRINFRRRNWQYSWLDCLIDRVICCHISVCMILGLFYLIIGCYVLMMNKISWMYKPNSSLW